MKKVLLIILLAMTCISPSNGQAETMTFLTGGISPPYAYEENGRILGMDRDVVAEFCKENGIAPEFQAYPWKRALDYVERGRSGAIFSLLRSEEREGFLCFSSVPLNSVKTVIISKKGRGFRINSLSDLTDKDVGVVNGHKYGPEFDNFQGLKKTPCRDKQELMKMLERDRIDVIVDSEDVFRHMCKTRGIDPEKFETIYIIAENPIYVAFSRKALGQRGAELAEKFDIFFNKISKNGMLNKIRSQYR